jgi:hypothetical protein
MRFGDHDFGFKFADRVLDPVAPIWRNDRIDP